jgi:hypothetical protein
MRCDVFLQHESDNRLQLIELLDPAELNVF